MHSLTTEVAIIGAGTAGCFMANLLDEAGIDCLLIEKSRGFGGRCSRRRIGNDYSIDLGAPEFSPSNVIHPLLKEKLSTWVSAGYLSPWTKNISRFDTPAGNKETLETLCGTPSMSTWHNKIAGHINSLTQSRVHRIKRADSHWHLLNESHQLLAISNRIVITSPPEQAIDLLNSVGNLSYSKTLPSDSLPQYVCAIGFTQPLNMNADVYKSGHALLHTAIRENSKPDRTCPVPLQEIWILHSTHEWAQQQCHADSGTAAIQLTESFCQHFCINAKPSILTSHYWRMAQHKTASQENTPFIWNDALKVGCCGDWLGSGGTFGALNSALALHQTMLK